MSVLVWIEQSAGSALTSGWEVLGKGRELAAELRRPLIALLIGDDLSASAAAAQKRGADLVLTASSLLLGDYRLSAYAQVLNAAIDEADATIVLTSATVRGRELSAAVACDRGAGLAPDAVDLRIENGKLVAVRTVYSGNILADIVFNSPIQLASVRPRSFPLLAEGDATGEIKVLPVALDEAAIPEKVLESQSSGSGEIALTDAERIVSGGRGVAQNPELGFKLVADLAKVLNAAVGASRAAVDAGYIPYKHQVGQTGKTVSPNLYIASGISGAIQHLAGMGSSKLIVAINKDAEAPIFSRAHYGIVGDLYEVLPALTEEFKKRLS